MANKVVDPKKSAAAKKAAETRRRNGNQKGNSGWGKFWAWLKQWWWKLLLLLLAILLLLPLLLVGLSWYVGWLSNLDLSRSEGPATTTGDSVATYTCNAVQVGAPVETAGECAFCTINYSKPGEVFIVGETPMEYRAGAWVYQYNTGNIDAFNSCIDGQGFMSDSAYTPVRR